MSVEAEQATRPSAGAGARVRHLHGVPRPRRRHARVLADVDARGARGARARRLERRRVRSVAGGTRGSPVAAHRAARDGAAAGQGARDPRPCDARRPGRGDPARSRPARRGPSSSSIASCRRDRSAGRTSRPGDVPLPAELPLGWHRLEAMTSGRTRARLGGRHARAARTARRRAHLAAVGLHHAAVLAALLPLVGPRRLLRPRRTVRPREDPRRRRLRAHQPPARDASRCRRSARRRTCRRRADSSRRCTSASRTSPRSRTCRRSSERSSSGRRSGRAGQHHGGPHRSRRRVARQVRRARADLPGGTHARAPGAVRGVLPSRGQGARGLRHVVRHRGGEQGPAMAARARQPAVARRRRVAQRAHRARAVLRVAAMGVRRAARARAGERSLPRR